MRLVPKLRYNRSMSRPTASAIKEYLEGALPEMLALLKALVRAESPSLVAEAQTAVQTILADAFRSLNFDVQHIPGQGTGGQLYAKPRYLDGAKPKQLLLGHSDTVWPLGTLAEMPVEIEGNKMRGPGVYDMKGGLAQMIFALRALEALGAELPLEPFVFINSDEEIGSYESAPRIMQLAAQMERVFVLEPALGRVGRIKTARKGVGQFHITAYGWAAHAGLDPDRGASAIVAMSNVIQQLAALNDLESGVTVNVGMVEGGERPNVIAPECKIVVDVRVPRVADVAPIEAAIRAVEPKVPIVILDVQGGVNRMPLERTARNQALWRRTQALGREMGVELEEGMAGGGSDGNITSQFTATLDGLGAVGDGAHARHEFIYIDKLVERTTLLALLLLEPSVAENYKA